MSSKRHQEQIQSLQFKSGKSSNVTQHVVHSRLIYSQPWRDLPTQVYSTQVYSAREIHTAGFFTCAGAENPTLLFTMLRNLLALFKILHSQLCLIVRIHDISLILYHLIHNYTLQDFTLTYRYTLHFLALKGSCHMELH